MRLILSPIADLPDLLKQSFNALKALAGRDVDFSACFKKPLENSCSMLISGGAVAMITQTRVHDPDYLAEFSAYYSRQFIDVSRFCTRLHFFRCAMEADEEILPYLDRVPKNDYLGFITLRPVVKSPVGVSILSAMLSNGMIRGLDHFPVHLGGLTFSVHGTPFMQQDNAVGACAQASIWMALRTLRKREGDRAYDPAQITDAATRYLVTGRVRPNRQGLSSQQMIEAIRTAGYAPHQIPLGPMRGAPLTQDEIDGSKKTLSAYIESGIPVVLLMLPPSGGHAVVAIGKTIMQQPQRFVETELQLSANFTLKFKHAISWSPSLLIHNDNTGPYRELPDNSATDYEFRYAAMAIPLLPTDIFMSGEEAFAIGNEVLGNVFQSFVTAKIKSQAEVEAIAQGLVLRVLLVEKRRLRSWATSGGMVIEMSQSLRLMDLPKRVWVFEIHRADVYGASLVNTVPSLVGLILIDPTADVLPYSILLLHLNLPDIVGLPHGTLVTWDTAAGAPQVGVQTNENGPIVSISHG
ncbi:MAG: hypothetical protein JWQ01_4745 [Massilia sp.]|nr:hypothetical protein [Massilia sp.]